MKNLLQLPLDEFKLAIKPYSAKRPHLTEVLLAFKGAFLSLDSGEVKVVMTSEGSCSARAYFLPEILRAIAMVPPSQEPSKEMDTILHFKNQE